MSSVSVRQATIADLDSLALLFSAYRRFQGKANEPEAEQAFLKSRFEHNESVVFIAHEGESPQGFAQLFPSYSSVSLARVYILNDLFVLEAARRKGVARRLLAAAEAHAWSFAAARVTLNVARENSSGRALYEREGWSQDAQFFMYHRFPPKPPEPSGPGEA
jgi:GNAT superfamily N-acetyltransferase